MTTEPIESKMAYNQKIDRLVEMFPRLAESDRFMFAYMLGDAPLNNDDSILYTSHKATFLDRIFWEKQISLCTAKHMGGFIEK